MDFQLDLGDVILADDCFLGSVVDIVNEDEDGNANDDDDDELVVGKMTADDEDQDERREEEVNLDVEDDQESTTSSVDLRLLDNSYSFSEDEDMPGGKELEAVAEEVKEDGKKRKNNSLMPTFRIKFRTKKERAASQEDEKKDMLDNRDPVTGKRPVGRPRKHPPKGKTALYLSDLPQAPKGKRGPGTGRRGPRGPYKKRAKLGYAANPVNKEKNHYKKDDEDEEDEDDAVGRLTICDKSSGRGVGGGGRRGDKGRMKQREKERRDKLALWIEVLRKMVPGVFDKTERYGQGGR